MLAIWAVFAAGCGAGTAPATPTTEGVNLDLLVNEAVETQHAEAERRAATMTAAATQPAVLMAQTLTPTITFTPEATATPTISLPTSTPGDTPTPTQPLVPTRQSDDPALRLGDPDWVENFDTTNNWSEFNGTRSQIAIQNGKFYYTEFTPGSGPTWTVGGLTISNFYLEVLALTPNQCGGKDRYGLVFRAPDPSQGYRFEYSCDGQYRVVEFSDELTKEVVPWASSDYLKAGPNQLNRLGVWANGHVVSIHVNGMVVASWTESTYRTGHFGFSITSEETENFTVVFDDLQFWTFE